MKRTVNFIRILFFTLFLLSSIYILFIETERYESASITLLKDLSEKQEMNLGSMLLGKGSETVKDSKVLELFIRSSEMYQYLDKKYHLSRYYASSVLDPKQRLYTDAILPAYRLNKENLLKAYNRDLFITFDSVSETLTLKFAHADRKIAQSILQSIIAYSDDTINSFSRENARIALGFIQKQVDENRKEFMQSIKKLIAYQNKHHTIDPTLDVTRKNTILATLEADLIKKEVEYSSKLKAGWNPNGKEMRMLQVTIRDIKSTISKTKKELSGNTKNSSILNVSVFDFQVLKNEMEFNKEIYRKTLIKREELKIETNQNAKHLITITKPTLAQSYTYPNKLWDIFTVALMLLFLYSIIVTAIIIVRDHQD